MATQISDAGGTGHVLVGGNSNLKVQAQKRRELEAKQLLPQPTKARPLFGPPIQVNRTNDPTHAKLSDLFGRYDEAKELVASNTHYGAVLQPPTPRPQAPLSPLPAGSLTSSGIRNKPEIGLVNGDRHHFLHSSSAEVDRKGVFERFKRQQQANAADATKSSDRTLTKTASVPSSVVVAADVSRVGGASTAVSSGMTVEASHQKHVIGLNDGLNKASPLAVSSGGRTLPSSTSGHERNRHQNRHSDSVRRTGGHESHRDRPVAAPIKENKAASSNNKPVASKSSPSTELVHNGTPTSLEKSASRSVQSSLTSSVKSAVVSSGGNSTSKLPLQGTRDSHPVAKLETPGKLKLTIPSPKDHGEFEDFVSDLLKEVSVPPPLTAIHSPKKHDSASNFSFIVSLNGKCQDSHAISIPAQARSNGVANGLSDSSRVPQLLQHHRSSPVVHSEVILSEDDEDEDHLSGINKDSIPPSSNAHSPTTRGSSTHSSFKSHEQCPPVNQFANEVKTGRVQPIKPARHRPASEYITAESPPRHLNHDDKNVHESRSQSSTSSVSHSILPNDAVVFGPKAETSHQRVVKKQSTVDSTTAGSTSSDSDGETSDESDDEESESNSSDEDSTEQDLKREGDVAVAAHVQGSQLANAGGDVDVDKQNTSNWGLLNFIRPGKSQVPSCMTAPKPVPVVPVVQSLTLPDIYPDSVEDLETLCSSLLFDHQPALSPLPVDKSSVLDSMSHDIDDVFDSVMKGESDELPSLVDLTSQLKFAPQASDEAAFLSNMPLTPPVLPVIPPALTFANGRPSVVVRLRRIPSRNYISTNDKALHMDPVVKLERVPSAVSASYTLRLQPAQLESTLELTDSPDVGLSTSDSKPKLYIESPKVTGGKCSKASPSPESKINASCRVDVPESSVKNGSTKTSVSEKPVPLKNGSNKSTVSQSPHKSDLKKKLSDSMLNCSSGKNKVPLTNVQSELGKKQDIIDSPVAKQRKIQKDEKRSSSETSKNEMRHKTEKRKSDLVLEGVSDAKHICDNSRRAVNSVTKTVDEKRSISISRSEFISSNSEVAEAVFSEVKAHNQPVLLPVAPMLTPPPSVVDNSYATDGFLSSSSSESQPHRPTNAKYEKTVTEPSSTESNLIKDQIDGRHAGVTEAITLQIKTESERPFCNGVLDMKKASTTPDMMTKSSNDSMESVCKDKRVAAESGNIIKPLDRRKDVPRNVRLNNDKLTSNCYLEIGQKLKHQGDATIERIERMLIYLESVLMFIRHGEALESEGRSLSVLYANRKETLRFCQSVCDLHYFNRSNSDINRSKLTVLGLRLLSFIHHKLYNLKKFELRSLRRTVDESLQNPSLKPLQVPSPYNGQGSTTPAALNDTLSPLSSHLTPSPAGSVSSVGSAGSQGNDHCTMQRPPITNGLSKFVAVPQQVYSNMLGYVGFVGHLHDCHEHWDQADSLTASNPALVEFFASIDSQCEKLHLGSDMSMISQYCYQVFDSFRPARS